MHSSWKVRRTANERDSVARHSSFMIEGQIARADCIEGLLVYMETERY